MALENVILHFINTFFVFLILIRLGARRGSALLGALVFAVHPLNVESVAWISQRKTQIASVGCLSSIWVYLDPDRGRKLYPRILVPVLMLVSLLGKQWAVGLPLILMGLDAARAKAFSTIRSFWKGQWASFNAKWPLFAIAILSSVVAFLAQKRGGAVASLEGVPMGCRLGNIIQATVNYLFDFMGCGLYVPFYPTVPGMSIWTISAFLLFLLGITGICLYFLRRHPALAAGWWWFIIFLLPVVGFVQIGNQSRADRYMYLPMIGLIWMLVCLGEGLCKLLGEQHGRWLLLLPMAWVGFLGCRTYPLVENWKNTPHFVEYIIKNVGDDPMPLSILGATLARQGQFQEALPMLAFVVERQPGNHRMVDNLALCLYHTGRQRDGIQLCETVRQRQVSDPTCLKLLATWYWEGGQTDLADARTQEYNQVAKRLGLPELALVPHGEH